MPTIRDTVIQFLQQIRGAGETAPQPRGAEGAMPRLALSPGADVLATVMGKFDDGTALVRISSQLFAMELPSRFQSGDSVRLTFLNQDVRPTFTLANQTLSGTPVTLSPAGQLVKRIMSDPVPDAVTSKSSLPAMERLLDGPPTDTARLAGRLRQALGESGFFYESHLKEWAMGERPMAEVLREPQAALSRPEAGAQTAEMPLPDRPVVGDMHTEPTVSRMTTEEEVPDEFAPSPREKQAAESLSREPAPAGTRARDGEVRPNGRSIPEDILQRSDISEGATEGEAVVDAAGTPSTEKQPAESATKEPGRPTISGEKNDGIPVPREGNGKPVPDAATEQKDTSGIPPDDLSRPSASERSAASPQARTQASQGQEPRDPLPAPPGAALPESAERIPIEADSTQKAPVAAAEQRTRLLKETYGQLDPAPANVSRAEVERNAGISRPGPTGMRTEESQETPQTSPASTAGLSPVDEQERKDGASPAAPLHGEIADARALPLVRQQLNLLNSGVFLWQGEAWQGQPMEWEVREREAHPEQGEERGWQTTLRLDLPNLGRVSGVINLEGKDLRLTLEAGSADSASLLGGRTGDLKDRLSAAGIEMKGVVVRHEELEGT